MSKNHPNDNIYSILGKLEALKPTPEEKRMSLVKEIRESVEAQGSIIEGVDAIQAKLAKQFAEGAVEKTEKGIRHHASPGVYGGYEPDADPLAKLDKGGVNKFDREHGVKFNREKKFGGGIEVDEKAPPGEKAERMVKGIKKSLSKDGHLSDKDKAIAYATTWKAHNKGQVEEAGAVCAKCGMAEAKCGCDHTNEGDATHTGGEKVTTNKGVIHKSRATVDTEKELSRGDVPDLDKDDDAPAKSAEKKGRGRPKMAAKDRSAASLPTFGAKKHNLPKWPKEKTRVHKMVGETLEDKLSNLTQDLLIEGRYLEDATGESFNHIMNRFRTEVRNFEQGGDLDENLYDALYDYYVECGEMPYGVQKARTGDPERWVAEQLQAELGDIAYGKDPANAEDAGLEMEAGIPGSLPPEQIPGKEDLLKGKGRSYYEEEEVTMEDELNELARLAGIQTSEGNAFTGKLKDTPKGGEFELDGKTFKDTSSLGETDLEEEETDEGNAFGKAVRDAKADGIQSGEKVEVGGKTYPVKEGMGDLGQDASEFNVSTNMSSDGEKNVTVTATGEHAAELLQMLRIAGLGGGQAAQDLESDASAMGVTPGNDDLVIIGGDADHEIEEEGIEVDQPAVQPANAPDEKYGTIKNITSQGDDLNREKRQDPGTANKAANPMTNAQQVLKAVAQLESKLAEEYESIKKVSK